MIRHLGWLIGLNPKSGTEKRLPDASTHTARIRPFTMSESVQEIAIYLHRFHNLDLFQQGWYQIKITMRWEDGEMMSVATPARVVQYEAPDLGFDDVYGVWRIDDTDNSFLTPPFRIRYARQDVRLSMMISFNLSLTKCKGPPSSAVILKFELFQAPITESGRQFLSTLDVSSVAVHEFRVPPKALLGVHSYCPVYFDAFHAVLVDVSVHVTLLQSGHYRKVHSGSSDSSAEGNDGIDQDLVPVDLKEIALVKAFLLARDTLLEEMHKLSKAINQVVDLSEFRRKMNDIKMLDSVWQANLGTADGEVSGQGKQQNGLETENAPVDYLSERLANPLSVDELTNIFHTLGAQQSYLWGVFMQFHRENKIQILEFLRDGWSKNRRVEWSIWMVYSKVDMPHHYISSGNDETSHSVPRRVAALWKLAVDPAQAAAARAELHRRSIAQMRINTCSIQDLYIFGDPLRIPIVNIERVINAPRRTMSENSYFKNMDMIDSHGLGLEPIFEAGNKALHPTIQPTGRDLKIVVFVHGFQGHHLDLRLVRNQWLLIDSKIEFLMSQANEEKTSGDFREMGQRLAQEVVSFVKKKMDKVSRSGQLRDIKLSFAGHSIGNVIIRSALSESVMEPYLRYLYTYVSVSGPHLGYLYSSNSLFNSGMWLLKKLKGTQCIHQLTFTDDPDLRNTFFYQLCQHKTLDHFRNIILMSSPQDGYVPYHSARIELCQAATLDHSKRGKVFLEMLNNCLDQIRTSTTEQRLFMRCDVNFDTTVYGKNFNTFIGRAAHIEFLESDVFAKFIMWSFPELFR
ncbi:Protein FAM135B [Linum grandiflorum]